MAPQATATSTLATSVSISSSAASASAIIADAVTSVGVDTNGLTQAQIGGLLGGILAAVFVILLIWYWATHTTGYLEYYHNNRSYYHGRHGWPHRQNRARAVYEAEVSYDETDELTEEETADVNTSSRSRRRQRQQHAAPEMTIEQYNAILEAQMYAAAQAQAQECARQARPPGVSVVDDYVLNSPPLRFPPTIRRSSYRQSAQPQYP